jgi:hypothetical protein
MRSMIFISNKSQNNMQLADEVIFEIYFRKFEKLSFQRIIPKFFDGTFRDFFLET